MSLATIVKGNTFSLAIPLQVYAVEDGEVVLRDYTPESGDAITIRLKGDRRNYTYTPSTNGSTAFIHLEGSEVVGVYAVEVEIVKDDDSKLTSMRFEQLSIVESIDELNLGQITEGIEQGAIYLDSEIFIAGKDGRGIVSIVKTATSGLVDTYTITYTDNTTSTFNVTNGANGINGQDGVDGADGVGIASIAKTGTQGLVDTYTITMTNGTTYTYQVTNGKNGENGRDGEDGQDGTDGVGIATINKTGTSGLVDTYTITLTNGETATFQVTNGMDGVDLGAANIVDNLTTGGSTNVLSAEQGKVIGNMLMTTSETEGAETTMTGSSAECIANKGIASDGSEVSVQWKSATPYLEIYPLSQVKFQGYSATNDYGIAFYDEDKNFIVGSWHNIPDGRIQTFTAPEGARYVRATLISSTTSSYIKYHPIVTTQVEIIPELEDRIEALENAEVNVVDNLNSSSATDALSANQGQVIGGCIYDDVASASTTRLGLTATSHTGKGVISDGTLASTGNLQYSRYSDFIPVVGGTMVSYKSNAPTTGGVAFYTTDNESGFVGFLASSGDGHEYRMAIPMSAKFMRITFLGGVDSQYLDYYAPVKIGANVVAQNALFPFINKRIAILGDSLTWLSLIKAGDNTPNANMGWVTHFSKVMKFAELRNYARSGATWSHTASTQYDITEDTTSISNDNVIYNQLNRLINDVENNGVTAPDFIFILAGTNDAWYPSSRPDAVADTPTSVMSDESVWLNVKSIGSLTSIPKAMRYVAEMIWNNFPDCQVVVTTPLQSTAFTTDRREAIAESIKGSAEYLSWSVIEQDKVCDISRIREHQGYYMTYDGTHTSEAGAKMVGEILASQLTNLLGR